jgi:hypothetical protein
MKKTIFTLWMLALTMILGLASCSEKDDNAGDNGGDTSVVDPSDYWKQCDAKTFMAGIGDRPLALQQAIGRTFPNTVGSLDEAEVAIIGFDWALAHMWEVDFFYKANGTLLLLPPKGEDYQLLDHQEIEGWDELVWAMHKQQEDIFYLLDEPEEFSVVNDKGQQELVTITKDQNYFNGRLTVLADWINGIEKADDGPAAAARRAKDEEKSDLDKIMLSLQSSALTYTINFPFTSGNLEIDHRTGCDPDYLEGSSSVSVEFKVMPIYMGSVNSEKAGDYYAIRSKVTPHNNNMWMPSNRPHGLNGWLPVRIYGFWFNNMDYLFSLIDPDTKNVAEGTRFEKAPYPANSISARSHSEQFSYGFSGSLSGGPNVKGSDKGGGFEARFGFQCQWTETVNYSLPNIEYSRNTATNEVNYHWESNNVRLSDDWPNTQKNFPIDVTREFDAENVWLWHIPNGHAGVRDESQKTFNLKTMLRINYSTWYHESPSKQYDSNRRDWWMKFYTPKVTLGDKVDVENPGEWVCCTIALPKPDRGKWGLFSLTNNSTEFVMRNVKIYKKGEEDKEPVLVLNQVGYEHKEAAEAAVRAGEYTATFEFVDPNWSTLKGKGTLSGVNVVMSKSKDDATKYSTVQAVIEKVE